MGYFKLFLKRAVIQRMCEGIQFRTFVFKRENWERNFGCREDLLNMSRHFLFWKFSQILTLKFPLKNQ